MRLLLLKHNNYSKLPVKIFLVSSLSENQQMLCVYHEEDFNSGVKQMKDEMLTTINLATHCSLTKIALR